MASERCSMPNKQPGSVFKRWENDAELMKRILTKHPAWLEYAVCRTRERLDELAEQADLQRRIVEDEA